MKCGLCASAIPPCMLPSVQSFYIARKGLWPLKKKEIIDNLSLETYVSRKVAKSAQSDVAWGRNENQGALSELRSERVEFSTW